VLLFPEPCSIADALIVGAQQCLSGPVGADQVNFHADALADAKIDAQVLLCAVLDCNRAYLHTWSDKTLSDTQSAQYKQFIQQRKRGEPVAYILGYQEFYGREFLVSPATLIPRPETEQLVDVIIDKIAELSEVAKLGESPESPESPERANVDYTTARVLDLGTGTGAIAISAALECPSICVQAVDFVPAAVVLAKQNAQRLIHNHAERVTILQSDWFTQVSGTFDIIVSNPPYVELDSEYLAQGDVRFEPDSALTAADNGLADIKLIVAQAPDYLHKGGWLLIEHGYQQADSIQQLFTAKGFSQVATLCDYAQHPRITLGQK
jgi:release factor glutamine methyltransferase